MFGHLGNHGVRQPRDTGQYAVPLGHEHGLALGGVSLAQPHGVDDLVHVQEVFRGESGEPVDARQLVIPTEKRPLAIHALQQFAELQFKQAPVGPELDGESLNLLAESTDHLDALQGDGQFLDRHVTIKLVIRKYA